ncbi:MAG: hypothetical protein HY322_04945 [Betaproteobacteria bacterium]|nr:hypothetical protein [Betaproteobacteria bacterium]
MPTVTVVTDVFLDLGRAVATALGSPDLRTSVIDRPLAELREAEVRDKARNAFQDITSQLFAAAKEQSVSVSGERLPRILELSGSLEEVNDYFYAQRWTDGLPIMPPVCESVERLLAVVEEAPDAVIGVVAPRMGMATIEKIAINAVMAGCEPGYFPVVLAAVKAICRPEFNLLPMQATTNPVTPMVIVNGPVVKQLQLNAGYNVLGQGWKANATIGRALRLVLNNIGGGVPGKVDKACHGQPGKFSLCIAENEEASPWEPFHVERGFSADDSTVSVIGVAGTQDIIHYARTSAQKVLDTLVRSIPREGYKNLYSGGEPLLILGPEQATILSAEGLSKKDIKRFVFEGTKVPLSLFHPETVDFIRGRRPRVFPAGRETNELPIADSEEDIQIIVAGGAGNHNVFMPTWGDTRCVTVKI